MLSAGLAWCGYLLTVSATIYAIIAFVSLGLKTRKVPIVSPDKPWVTVLKPLCGMDPDTYECLRSFCDQDYPNFQIVFGVADPKDPAVAVVERLQGEFPQHDIKIMVDRSQHGSSRKISNVINMMPLASHDYLVLSDGDVRVTRDYLTRVVAPLLERDVGIVTCAYRGISRRDLWSVVGSIFINDWFMPSVRVAALFGFRAFSFGATIAIRREVLARIGGFPAIANQLADDYRLGELTRRLGFRCVLSELMVDTCVVERSFADLVRHELRWLRTIRTLQPMGYAFCFVTFGIPVAALGTLLARGAAPAVAMLLITVVARVLLHVRVCRMHDSATHLLLLPARELLNISLWSWSFVTRSVQWRDSRYRVGRDGSVRPLLEDLSQ